MTKLDEVLKEEDPTKALEAALDLLSEVKALVPHPDAHRNRLMREGMDGIRVLLGQNPDPNALAPSEVREPAPVAIEAPEPAAIEAPAPAALEAGDDLGEKDASNDSGGTLEPEARATEGSASAESAADPVSAAPEEPVKRGPGRPRKTPAIAED